MPNGHGGIPYLGSPILLALLLVVAISVSIEHPSPLGYGRAAVCLILAAACGWRLAYHLHMREADEYGGAYTSEVELAKSRGRYRALSAVYAAVFVAATVLVLHSRGTL